MRSILNSALLAALASMASPASADIRMAYDGRGDALYLPYYTVENGKSTLLSVRNESTQTTSAIVRFVEALNGQGVLYFLIQLPAGATWTGAVVAEGEDGARLVSDSDVCTTPVKVGRELVFSLFRNFDYANNFPDGGGDGTERTRSGAIEVLEYASLGGEMADEVEALQCQAIEDRYASTPNEEARAALNTFMEPSTGSLSASVQVVDVAAGSVFSYEAVALDGVYGTPRVAFPGDPLPRLATPTLAGDETAFFVQSPLGRLSFDADRGPDAISSLFMTTRLNGEVAQDQALGAATDWVLAFPTRHAYVAERPGSLYNGGAVVAPFTAQFGAGGACESIGVGVVAPTGGEPLDAAFATIPSAEGGSVCGQTTLLKFAAEPGVEDGTARLSFDGELPGLRVTPAGTTLPVVIQGLPVVGLRLSNFVNEGVDGAGTLANYSFATPLRAAAIETD